MQKTKRKPVVDLSGLQSGIGDTPRVVQVEIGQAIAEGPEGGGAERGIPGGMGLGDHSAALEGCNRTQYREPGTRYAMSPFGENHSNRGIARTITLDRYSLASELWDVRKYHQFLSVAMFMKIMFPLCGGVLFISTLEVGRCGGQAFA